MWDLPFKFTSSEFALKKITWTEIRHRTWKERLFSLPWRPWKGIEWVECSKLVPGIFLLKGTTVIYHPSLRDELYEQLAKNSAIPIENANEFLGYLSTYVDDDEIGKE